MHGIHPIRDPDEPLTIGEAPDVEWFDATQRIVPLPIGETAVVDEGPRDGPCVLLLHGLPAWGYLWRRVLPPLLERGYRVVAPDLLGYGNSARFLDPSAYTLAAYDRWMNELVECLDIEHATLVAHDFGGMVGLRHLGMTRAARFDAAVLLDTSLNDGHETYSDAYLQGFTTWKSFLAGTPHGVLSVGAIIAAQANGHVNEIDVAAYDAVFPTEQSMNALRVTDGLYPLSPTDPGAAEGAVAKQVLSQWEAPVAVLFSDAASRFHPGHFEAFNSLFPSLVSAAVAEGTGHFLPEERPDLVARAIDDVTALASSRLH